MLKKRRYHKHGAFRLKLKKQTVYTVAAIWMWIFAGAIFLSFFGGGTALSRLHDALYAKVEWAIYLLPIFLVSLSLLFFKVKSIR